MKISYDELGKLLNQVIKNNEKFENKENATLSEFVKYLENNKCHNVELSKY